jgi:hypothetical protein
MREYLDLRSEAIAGGWRSFTRYCKGDEIKEDEVGEASNTHKGNGKCIQNFSRNTCREEIT